MAKKEKLLIRFCPNNVQKKEDGPLEICGRERTKLNGGLSWVCPGCNPVEFAASQVHASAAGIIVQPAPMNATERLVERLGLQVSG